MVAPMKARRALTAEEVATLLCALRTFQEGGCCRMCLGGGYESGHFEDVDPLDRDAVDILCEQINFGNMTIEEESDAENT